RYWDEDGTFVASVEQRPAGDDVRGTRGLAGRSETDAEERRARRAAPRTLWHASPGSPGR
ncbi:hypothetical protein, partial [Angustibacter speluncae]